MAQLTIADESVEVTTKNPQRYKPTIEIEVNFETEESINTDYIKSTTIFVGSEKRGNITFERVEKEINEHLDKLEDVKVVEITRIDVYEKRTFKRTPYDFD